MIQYVMVRYDTRRYGTVRYVLENRISLCFGLLVGQNKHQTSHLGNWVFFFSFTIFSRLNDYYQKMCYCAFVHQFDIYSALFSPFIVDKTHTSNRTYCIRYSRSNASVPLFKPLDLLFIPSECGSTVAMRTSAAEVNQIQSSGSGSGSSGQCFSNPSYHTVAQCNVVSTISSNLDGTLTLKVRPISVYSHQIDFPIKS